MMEPVAISWLVASATSPLMAVLSLWTVYVFHTYRKRWRTVDLFLLAVASQELVSSVFTFGYAIVSLVNPEIPALCSFVQWGLVAIRTFQMATLASMVVDRALTVRWPYRYRFSVRRNQIRYHVAVLALTSALVGVASIFAHNSPDVQQQAPKQMGAGRIGRMCSGHPLEWDFKFVVFLLAFHGVLLLVSLVCTVHIEAHRCRNGGHAHEKGQPFQLPDCSSDLPVPTSVTSPLDNDSHTGSTRALHRPYRQSSRRPYFNKNNNGCVSVDFRWPPVAIVSLICFSINHLPYLVLNSLATAMPRLWSPWHEALLSWLRLAEAAAVPLVLCLVDRPLRSALKRTFQRRSGALSPLAGDDGPFQMYFDKDHFRKRGTFGSVTPIGIITNYRRTPGKKRKSRNGSKCKYKLPGLQSGDSVLVSKKKTFLNGTEPLSKLSCADLTALEVWREEEEYASEGDGFSTFSGDSAVFQGDGDDLYDDEAKMCCDDDDVYGGSFTTIANDDFEFHDTRPCGGEVRMKPGLPPPTPLDEQPPRFGSALRSKTSTGFYIKEKPFEIEDMIPKAASTEKFCDLMNIAIPLFPNPYEDKKDPDIIRSSLDQKTPPATLSKATSFSMNDLDLIDDSGSGDEKVYVLPVKSESTMSLYRLRLESKGMVPQILLPVTKSENNVNGDSGYGTQTFFNNPIWPAHRAPARKASDPLSNCQKRSYYRQRSPDPMNVHPKMQRLPWISAWKKLGENVDSSGHNSNDSHHQVEKSKEFSFVNDNFELRQRDPFQWKDSIVYSSNVHCYKEEEDGIVYTHIQPENFATDNDIYGEKFKHKSVIKKNSFNENIQNNGSYGKIKNNHQNENPLVDDDVKEKFRHKENIYEEIIHSNPVTNVQTPLKGKIRNNDGSVEDISYAQTDIINFSGNSNVGYPSRRNQDFTLNISIRPVPDNSHLFQAHDPVFSNSNDVSNYSVSYPPDVNLNVCDGETGENKPPRLSRQSSWRNSEDKVLVNSKVVTSHGKSSTGISEDIDNISDNFQFAESRTERNTNLENINSNLNLIEDTNRPEKLSKNINRSSSHAFDRKMSHRENAQRPREGHSKIKRRESSGRTRRSRSERIESSDDQLQNAGNVFPIAEKDEGSKGSSSSSPKRSKKIRRSKRPRAESNASRDGRKNANRTAEAIATVSNEGGDGLWPRVLPAQHVSRVDRNRDKEGADYGMVEPNIRVNELHSVEKGTNDKNVCLELSEVPSIAAKDLYDRNNLWRRDSRSKNKYQLENENNLNYSSQQQVQHYRRRPLIRSEAIDLADHQQLPLTNVRIFSLNSTPNESPRQRIGKVEFSDHSRNNRVVRRSSGNDNSSGRRMRRSSVDFETTTEQESSKRIRRSESDQKRNSNRRKAFVPPNEDLSSNGNFETVNEQEDINKNVGTDPQQELITKRGERNMDFLVYGSRRDNEPKSQDSSAVLPFETSAQPSYLRHQPAKQRHQAEKNKDSKEQRHKQKKPAVTDFL